MMLYDEVMSKFEKGLRVMQIQTLPSENMSIVLRTTELPICYIILLIFLLSLAWYCLRSLSIVEACQYA